MWPHPTQKCALHAHKFIFTHMQIILYLIWNEYILRRLHLYLCVCFQLPTSLIFCRHFSVCINCLTFNSKGFMTNRWNAIGSNANEKCLSCFSLSLSLSLIDVNLSILSSFSTLTPYFYSNFQNTSLSLSLSS